MHRILPSQVKVQLTVLKYIQFNSCVALRRLRAEQASQGSTFYACRPLGALQTDTHRILDTEPPRAICHRNKRKKQLLELDLSSMSSRFNIRLHMKQDKTPNGRLGTVKKLMQKQEMVLALFTSEHKLSLNRLHVFSRNGAEADGSTCAQLIFAAVSPTSLCFEVGKPDPETQL